MERYPHLECAKLDVGTPFAEPAITLAAAAIVLAVPAIVVAKPALALAVSASAFANGAIALAVPALAFARSAIVIANANIGRLALGCRDPRAQRWH